MAQAAVIPLAHDPDMQPAEPDAAEMTPKQRLKYLQAKYPVAEGTSIEIPEDLARYYEDLRVQVAYWDRRMREAVLMLAERMGTAETATASGLPVAQRRVTATGTYTVTAHMTDALYPCVGAGSYAQQSR